VSRRRERGEKERKGFERRVRHERMKVGEGIVKVEGEVSSGLTKWQSQTHAI
jgi:hypothetical protein